MGRPEDDFDLWSDEQTRQAMRDEAIRDFAKMECWPLFQESLLDGYDALDNDTAEKLWDAVIHEKPEAVKALLANLRKLFFDAAAQQFDKENDR